MTAVKNVAALLTAFVLVLVSLPWILWGIAYMVRGDEDAANRLMTRSPFWRWLDYMERPL